MRLPLKQLAQDGATQGQVITWNDTAGKYEPGDSNLAGGLSASNRDMAALGTTADNQLATNTTLAATVTAWVEVQVNGVGVEVGDGVKTKGCYLSGDSGTTARAYGALASGDQLYWVGSVAGYQLSTADRIDIIFDNEGAGGGGGGGGGGVDTMGAFGATPNANGGSIAGTTLTLQPADGTYPGGVSTAAQTFAGIKTFTDGIDNGGNVLANLADGVEATDAATVGQIVAGSTPFEYLEVDCSTATTIGVRNSATFYESRVVLAPNGADRAFDTELIVTIGLQTLDFPIYVIILQVPIEQAYSVTLYDTSVKSNYLHLASGSTVVLTPGSSIAFISDYQVGGVMPHSREMWRRLV